MPSSIFLARCDRRSGRLGSSLRSESADPCEGAHSAGSLVASCETVCSGDDRPARRPVRRAPVALQCCSGSAVSDPEPASGLQGTEKHMTSKSSDWRLVITVSVCAGVLGLTAPQPMTAAGVLLVPGVYPTIQAAIDAAAPGDTVRVGPGTYHERIDFRGKTIVVESTGGAATTIIQPNGAVGAIVTMSLTGAQSPVLRGFTVRGGVGDFWAGGIYISGGSPTVEHNVVTGNAGCLGGGITVQFSNATIRSNTIANNTMPLCSGGNGGGIRIAGAAAAQVLGNIISGNTSDTDGGGIALFAAGRTSITGNVIPGHVARSRNW